MSRSVDGAGSGPARIAARPAGRAAPLSLPAGAVRNGEDRELPVHPPALALRALDPSLPAHEPLEPRVALPAPILVDWHHFTITDPQESRGSALGRDRNVLSQDRRQGNPPRRVPGRSGSGRSFQAGRREDGQLPE